MIQHLAALSVHAYYAGELDAGRRACERLLSLPGLSQEMEMQTRVNRTFYTQRLDELIGCRFVRLDVEPAHDGWSAFNPTIADQDRGVFEFGVGIVLGGDAAGAVNKQGGHAKDFNRRCGTICLCL